MKRLKRGPSALQEIRVSEHLPLRRPYLAEYASIYSNYKQLSLHTGRPSILRFCVRFFIRDHTIIYTLQRKIRGRGK